MVTSRHCFCYEPSGEVSGKTFKVGHHCVEASLGMSARYAGSRTEDASAKQSVLNSVFTDSGWSGDRPTRKSVSSWVVILDGFLISAGARHEKLSTSRPSQPRVKRRTSKQNVVDANTKPCRQTFAGVLPIKDGRHRDPETVS